MINSIPEFNKRSDTIYATIEVEFKGASYTRSGLINGRNILAETVSVRVLSIGGKSRSLGTWQSLEPEFPDKILAGEGDIVRHITEKNISDMKRFIRRVSG